MKKNNKSAEKLTTHIHVLVTSSFKKKLDDYSYKHRIAISDLIRNELERIVGERDGL